MTTRLRGTNDHRFHTVDSIFRGLQQCGATDIIRWILKYTGTSSDAATELSAPDAAYDGSVEEVTTVLFTNTKINTVGSEYLSIPFSAATGGGSETMHYFYVDKAEISTVTCLAKADIDENSTFHFFVDDGAGSEDEYYCWMDKGTGVDPEEDGTAIACDISGATTATEVAEVIDGLIDAKADVGCANAGAVLTITNGNNGDVTDCYDGVAIATGFIISIEQGGDDPAATGTGHSCDISGATTAADVGTIFVAAITAIAGLTATGTTTATIESDNTGSITDVAQSASSLGIITVINQGRDSYEGGYLYLVSASANDDDVADGHCRQTTVTGWDENGDYVADVVSMAGATHVKLNKRLKGVSHMYGSLFGTGGQDAADAITLETSNTTNATTLLTIAQGATESNGARIYVPDGQKILITNMKLFNITNANTGATIVTPMFMGFETDTNTDPDYDYLTAVVFDITNSRSDIDSSREIRVGTDTAVIITKEREVGVVGNEDFVFVMEFYTFR